MSIQSQCRAALILLHADIDAAHQRHRREIDYQAWALRTRHDIECGLRPMPFRPWQSSRRASCGFAGVSLSFQPGLTSR